MACRSWKAAPGLLLGELRLLPGGKQRGHHLLLDDVDGLVALRLGGDLVGLGELALAGGGDGGLDGGIVDRHEVARLLGGLLGEADDRLDHRLEALVPHHDGAEHHLFRQFLGLGLDHQHGVLRAGDDEVERGGLHLVDGRVELQRAADHADAGGADRPHEGDARQRQRGRGGDHRQDVGVVLQIMRQHGDDDLRVVAVALREQRADRPVDEAGDQRLLLRGASLALEIAARDAPAAKAFSW